ncbi:MAG: DUF3786 domain-containing protein [Desulfobacterium sp.]|nr:DUF3786 domain-containing protein [Desulfobacterium sp.]
MTTEKAGVFKETYENYLQEISGLDLGRIAVILGGEIRDNGLLISYFNREYTVSSTGVKGPQGTTPGFAISVVLLKYILMAPEARPIPRGEWRSFKDFADAGPLVTYFASTATQVVERAFDGKVDLLFARCRALGAKASTFSSSYDLSMELPMLPNAPLVVNFNDRDEEFPSSCTLLYDRTVESCLDMESVAITGATLAGLLVKSD